MSPAPDAVSGISQGMESLDVSENAAHRSGRHRRPARAYHDLSAPTQQSQYYQQQGNTYSAGITPVGTPFSGDQRNSPAPAQQQGLFQPYSAGAGPTQFTPATALAPSQNQYQPPFQAPQAGIPAVGVSQSQFSRNTNNVDAPGSVVHSGAEGIPKICTERLIADEKVASSPSFKTFENASPPAAGTDYNIVDQGLSGPQYARLTMYNVPTTDALRASTKLPLGLILRPFAPFSNLEYESGGVPISDFSQDVPPPRCTRCRTYMNPSMIFTQGGTHFICNMCQFSNAVSAEYFQPIDPSGRRIDWYLRPELAFGTYDVAVPKEYWKDADTPPSSLKYLFMIDVTQESVKRGLHTIAVDALRSALYGENLDPGAETRDAAERFAEKDAEGKSIPSPSRTITFPKGAQIAIATFDRTVHFYNLSSKLEQVQTIVMSDINDPFLPLEDGLFVNPYESQHVVESLFARIEAMFDGNPLSEPVFGAALEVAYQALEKTGGKISVVLGSLPSYGPGTVAIRDASKGYTGEREKELYTADSKFYKDLGKKFALAGIGLDLFMFPSGLIEVANIGVVSQLSGGHEYLYPVYVPERDGRKFIADFCRSCQGEIGTQVSLKIRCSTGLQVAAYFGNFQHDEWDQDPNLGSIDSHSTFGILFKYDGKLDPKLDVHFQSALLYTSSDGQRRVRINNIIASVTDQYKMTINFIDADACVGLIARDNISRLGEFTLKELRLRLNDRLIDVFTAYRQKVSTSLPPSQLLMPMTLRSFIPYLLCIQKSRPFRDQKLNADIRVYYARVMNSMSIDELATFLYPRIMGLHNLRESDCTYNEAGRFLLPVNITASIEAIDAGGVYFVYNGIGILLWIHRQVSLALLKDLFGDNATSIDMVDSKINELPDIDTDISIKARRLIKYFANRSGLNFLGVQIAREGLDGADYDFMCAMVEDPGTETFKYKDYVSFIHNRVKNKLENRNEKSTISYLSEHFPFTGGF